MVAKDVWGMSLRLLWAAAVAVGIVVVIVLGAVLYSVKPCEGGYRPLVGVVDKKP